jgi:hypothetical protein
MADRYWVGGSGTWDTTSTANWSATTGGASGASAPGVADRALFNASSGIGTVTLGENITIFNMTIGSSSITTFDWNNKVINLVGNATTTYTGSAAVTMLNNPTINCTYSGSTGTRTIAAGTSVLESNAINVNVTAGSDTVTLSSGNTVYKTINFTGFSGTLSVGNRFIYGSVIFPATMTHGTGTATTYSMLATSGSYVIDTNGISIDAAFTLNGGAIWSLSSNLTMGSTRTFTLTAGTLDLSSGNRTLSTGLFASSNSNTRSIAFGTGNITLTQNNATIFNISNAANFSYTGISQVNLTYAGATGTRAIAQGTGTTTEGNALNFYVSAGSDIISTASAGSYKTLDFTGFTGSLTSNNRTLFGNLVLSSGMTVSSGVQVTTFAATSGTQTITTNGVIFDNSLTFNGVGGTFAFQDALTQESTRAFTITNGTVQLKNGVTSTVGSFVANNSSAKFLQSTTPGSQATLSQAAGTVNVVDLTIRDINAVGGASWNAYTDFENTDAGNNDGWNFSLSPPYSTAELPITLRPFTQPRRF